MLPGTSVPGKRSHKNFCTPKGRGGLLGKSKAGQVMAEVGRAGVGARGFDDVEQRLGMDFGQIDFAEELWGESEALDRRCELGVDAGAIAAGIGAIPAGAGEQHGVQAVEAETMAFVVQAKTLVAKSGGDAIGSQE